MPPRTPESVLAPYVDRLGKEPDHIIAREAGVSRALIIGYRKRLGIPAYEGYKFGQSGNPVSTRKPAAAPSGEKRPSSFRGRRSALDPYADLLGKVPDGEIARMAGVTPENVRTYRSRRNIPAAWQKGDAAPAEAAAAAPAAATKAAAPAAPAEDAAVIAAPAGGLRTAYLVNVDKAGGQLGYAIVATDFADAARVAVELVGKRHPGAPIKAIQRIAELLG